MRGWFQMLEEEGGAENYRPRIEYRARRDALLLFFAQKRHLRTSDQATG